MRRLVMFLIAMLLILTFCSCGVTDVTNSVTSTIPDKYSYETESKIRYMFEDALSAYTATVSVYEEDDGLRILVSLRRIEKGSESFFADMLQITVDTAKQAKQQYDFEISELTQSFSLYKNGFNENASGAITFDTKDLEKGRLFVSTKNIVEKEISLEDTLLLLK